MSKVVGTLKARVSGDGKPPTIQSVLADLRRQKHEGRLSLALSTDNLAIYMARPVRHFLEENQVIHLHSRLHTRQDNAWVERAIGEAKMEAHNAGLAGIKKAVRRLNRRPRISKRGWSASRLDKSLPHC
jgi:transposase InsO family protein